jgi:ABC-type Fe3+ transport system permease subunit
MRQMSNEHVLELKTTVHLQAEVDNELNRARIQDLWQQEVKQIFSSKSNHQARIPRFCFLVVAVSILLLGSFSLVNVVAVDNIVNGNLYQYGLHFSNDWASAYQSALHNILSGLCAVFSCAGLILYLALRLKQTESVKPIRNLRVANYRGELYVFKD